MPSLWLNKPEPGNAVLRGLTLAHTHLYSGLARGMAVDMGTPENFTQILERLWWKLDVALDEESLRASAETALLDAVECGVTTLIDHHESPSFIDGSLDVLAEAARKIGIRLITTYGSTDRHGPEGALAGLAENKRFGKAVADDPMIHAMVGMHAGFTVEEGTLLEHVALSKQLGIGLHIHAGEDKVDKGSVRRLCSIGGLNNKTILAHAIHLTRDERDRAADGGAWVVHNPRSNQNNAVGYTDPAKYKGKIALGTDGMDSDLFTEARVAFLAGRQAYGPQGGVDAIAMLENSIELSETLAGKHEGDKVVLDYDPPTPFNEENAGGHILFGIGQRHIHSVTVNNEKIYEDGKHLRVDAAAIRANAREVSKKLWARL